MSGPGPWVMRKNRRTNRTEVFLPKGRQEVLVGSMPGDPTDEEIREMMRRLVAEEKA